MPPPPKLDVYKRQRYYRLNKALTQDDGTAHLLLFERRPGAPEELPPFKLAAWTANLDGHCLLYTSRCV